MSTLNFEKNMCLSTAPKWLLAQPESEYHRDAASGRYVSSTMLRHFRRCPAEYAAIVNGGTVPAKTSAMRFGRALHKLVLEGEGAYRRSFVVGGPWNCRTGRPYGHGARAFGDWLAENRLDGDGVVTATEDAALRQIAAALFRHREAARFLREGWAELSARAEIEGVACQARFDWFRPDGTIVDVKTIADLDRFEQNARRYGYLHQFALYRDVARVAGGVDPALVAVVLEKDFPRRVGVWRFDAAVLDPYSAQNRASLRSLKQCRERNCWPTGFDRTRGFPPACLPPLWLN